MMNSKSKLLLASVSPLALMGGANAADLPRKAPVAPMIVAPAFSWTGCYVGAHGGYGWGKNDATRSNSNFFFSSGFSTSSSSAANLGISTSGGVYGGQVGCNYQFASNWVVGVEANFAGANIKGSAVDPLGSGNTINVKTDFLGSAVVRLGFTTFNNQGLLYVLGGMGAAHNKWSVSSVPAAGFNEDRIGWTAGVGYGWMFTRQWSGFIEYAHFDFGSSGNSSTVTTSVDCGFDCTSVTVDSLSSRKQRIDVIKAGLNFKFAGP